MSPHGVSTSSYRRHLEFCEKHPEFMALAVSVISRWTQVQSLQVAIAEALIEVHAKGIAGEEIAVPKAPETPRKIMRRTR